MRIEKINVHDDSFVDILAKYLVESKPYSGYSSDLSNIALKRRVIKFIHSDLAKCDIATCFVSEEEGVLFYLFCNIDEKNKKLEIIFPFPNTNALNGHHFLNRWPFCFCHLMLDQLNSVGFDESYGTIQRRNRQTIYEKSLIRFGHKMFEVTDEDGDRFKKVTVRRENLVKAHEYLSKLYREG